jgi:hypothetical protein
MLIPFCDTCVLKPHVKICGPRMKAREKEAMYPEDRVSRVDLTEHNARS